ncbi:MAG: sulfite exporter TauE/SafE family protein [Gemmatimonadetes bacterium]|nr:sulfite exporter TauE/SafE family protein [Gemmatimonadota bacterium]
MDWSYWTAYWWMLPLAVPICATACAAAVEGATMFAPLFALGFPLLGVAALTPGQAVATALIVEVVGYSSGLLGHARQGTVSWAHARVLAALAVPSAAGAAVLAHTISGPSLLLIIAAALLGLGLLLWRAAPGEPGQVDTGDPAQFPASLGLLIRAADGQLYVCPPDPRPAATRGVTVVAGGVTGLVGMGIGEATSSQLMLRLKWPARVAIGTGVAVVLPVVVTASAVQAALLSRSGLGIPWNLVLWVVPAVLLGGQFGSHVTALLPERYLKRGVALLFALLAATIAASTLRQLAGP